MSVQRRMSVVAITFAALLAGAPAAGAVPEQLLPSPSRPVVVTSAPIRGLSAQVELPSKRMAAGSESPATVVVENTTGADVTVYGCLNLFYVALGNAEVDPRELLSWPACRQPIVIRSGTSRYPVTVAARYAACFGASTPPICVDDKPPPLPPGMYKARLYQNPANAVRPPRPIAVRVTR